MPSSKGSAPRRGAAAVSAATLQRAFAGLRPNQRVIELDRRQAEGFLSWEEYRDRIMVNPTRVQNGQRNYADNRALLQAIETRFRVSPRVIVAIWGVETNFGGNTGGFGVMEALATLAWEGRRAELLPQGVARRAAGAGWRPYHPGADDRQLGRGDGPAAIHADEFRAHGGRFRRRRPARHLGQPGRRARLHRPLLPEIRLAGGRALGPRGAAAGRLQPRWRGYRSRRSLRDWGRLGFRAEDGGPLPASELEAAIVLPNRGSGQVFLGHHNLRVIRRYNSPVNYGLAVGLLSDRFG